MVSAIGVGDPVAPYPWEMGRKPALFKLTHYLRESGAYCVAGEDTRTLAIPRAPNQGCPVGWLGTGPIARDQRTDDDRLGSHSAQD